MRIADTLACRLLCLCLAVAAAAWTGVDEDAEDVQLWGDNWDDDDAHYDDFANQLREELKKGAPKAAGAWGAERHRERPAGLAHRDARVKCMRLTHINFLVSSRACGFILLCV